MPALKKTNSSYQETPQAPVVTPAIREIAEGDDVAPVESPVLELQQALQEAQFHSDKRHSRTMSNTMLVLSLICAYALAMMMMVGSLTA